MSGSGTSDLYPEQRRSPRFPFDSLVRLTALPLGEKAQVWGRSADLSRGHRGERHRPINPEELVAMQIPLPSTKPMNARARCATAILSVIWGTTTSGQSVLWGSATACWDNTTSLGVSVIWDQHALWGHSSTTADSVLTGAER
jgi:hypothetical protein